MSTLMSNIKQRQQTIFNSFQMTRPLQVALWTLGMFSGQPLISKETVSLGPLDDAPHIKYKYIDGQGNRNMHTL